MRKYRSLAMQPIAVYPCVPLMLTAVLRLFRGRPDEEWQPSDAADEQPAANDSADAGAAKR